MLALYFLPIYIHTYIYIYTHTHTQSCLTLGDLMDCSQAPLSEGFSRQECWNGLPFPSPGHLSNPEI